MFLLNSRNHLTIATLPCSGRSTFTGTGHTFSQSYGAILPSSFTQVLSSALVFSTRPPVSVFGTVIQHLSFSDFSWKLGINYFKCISTPSYSRLSIKIPDFPSISAYTLKPAFPTPGQSSLLRHHITMSYSTGILTRFPSTTLLSLALGADSPCAD